MTIETHILDIIEGKQSAPLTKALLNLLSQCYRLGVGLRHFAYDTILPVEKVPLPVISVGNIVAGGTGKTPFVRYLAERLESKRKVAILSRGYRRKGEKTLVVKKETLPEECGDEPFWLAKVLSQAHVIVGSDRVFAGHLAQRLNAQVILLDDGMQYRRLDRDIEIGLIHAADPLGKGFFLPRGFLRDSPKRLSKAHLIVLTGIKDGNQLTQIEKQIRLYTTAPITVMDIIVENQEELASKKVAAFCAIAAPSRFFQTLKTIGCDPVVIEQKPDHREFSEKEIEQLSNRAHEKGAECLVCTEKDAVKLPKNLKIPLPIIPVKISFTPTFGKRHLEKIIQEVSR